MTIKNKNQFLQQMNRRGALLTMMRNNSGNGFITFGNHGGYYESVNVPASVISETKSQLKDVGHQMFILKGQELK